MLPKTGTTLPGCFEQHVMPMNTITLQVFVAESMSQQAIQHSKDIFRLLTSLQRLLVLHC